MAAPEPDLASRHDTAGGKQDSDPFETPPSQLSNSPTLPRPCAYPSHSAAAPRTAQANANWSTRHDRYLPPAAASYKPGSMSSNGDSAIMTPMSSVDLEKASLAKEQGPKRMSRESKRSKGSKGSKGSRGSRNRDPEKAGHSGSRSPSQQNNTNANAVTYMDDDEVDEGQQLQEDKACRILLFLAGPCVALSAINTVWACIALIITALSQPIRLCAKRPSFGQQFAGLLGPTLNLQLRCIYTPLPPHANEDGSYHTVMLAVIHVFSPFLSFITMFAAWVLAVYWMSSTIVGDPAGQDKRDDGKETVLGLRSWWESWLMRGIKED